MGQVKVYQQDRLASEAVGTPGVDKSAGDAMAALSQGAAGVLKSERAVADANFEVMANMAVGAATLIGRKMVQMRRQRQQQKNLLDDAALAEDITNFRDTAKADYNDVTNVMGNDPEAGEKVYRTKLDSNLQSLKDKWKSNPRCYAALQESMRSVVPTLHDNIADWNINRRTAIAQSQIKARTDGDVTKVMELQGSIGERLKQFNDIQNERRDYLTSPQILRVLSVEKADAEWEKFQDKAGVAFFHNCLADRPSDPREGVKFAQQMRDTLAKADQHGLKISAAQQDTLRGHIDALEDKYVKGWSKQFDIRNQQIEREIDDGIFDLKAHRDDDLYQRTSIENIKARKADYDAENAAIQADPTLPEEVKAAASSAHNKSVMLLNRAMSDAQGYMHHNESTRKTEKREAEHEAHEAERAAKHLAVLKRQADIEQKRLEKEEFNKQATAAENELSEMRSEITRLGADGYSAIKNRKQIDKLAAQLFYKASEANKAKYITGPQAAAYKDKAIALQTAANDYEILHGWFGATALVKHSATGKKSKGAELEAQAMKRFNAELDALRADHQEDELNNIAGMNQKRKTKMSSELARFDANVKAGKRSENERAGFVKRLREIVLADRNLN